MKLTAEKSTSTSLTLIWNGTTSIRKWTTSLSQIHQTNHDKIRTPLYSSVCKEERPPALTHECKHRTDVISSYCPFLIFCTPFRTLKSDLKSFIRFPISGRSDVKTTLNHLLILLGWEKSKESEKGTCLRFSASPSDPFRQTANSQQSKTGKSLPPSEPTTTVK